MSTAFPWVTNWSLLFYFYPVASQGIGLLDPVFTSCMVGLKGTRSNLTELYSSISNRDSCNYCFRGAPDYRSINGAL